MTTLKIKLTSICDKGTIHFRLDKDNWNCPAVPQMEFALNVGEVQKLVKALTAYVELGNVKSLGIKFDIDSNTSCPETYENFLPQEKHYFVETDKKKGQKIL